MSLVSRSTACLPRLAQVALGSVSEGVMHLEPISQNIAPIRSSTAEHFASHKNVTGPSIQQLRTQVWQGQWLSTAMSEALNLALQQSIPQGLSHNPSSSTHHTSHPPIMTPPKPSTDQHHAAGSMQCLQPPCMHDPTMPPTSPCTPPEPGTAPASAVYEAPSQPTSPCSDGLHEPDHAPPCSDGVHEGGHGAWAPLPSLECGARGNTYQPSRQKRINKHGLEKRLDTVLGRLTILNRIKKGRWRLTVDQVVGQVVKDTANTGNNR